MKIIITGGTGLLARYIAKELCSTKNEICVVVSEHRVDFAKELYHDRISIITNDEFFAPEMVKGIIPGACIINTAFTRKNDGREVASSMDYAYALFNACKKNSAYGVINISSRSVYEEPKEGEYNKEDSPINADSLIAAAKYGSELLLKAFFEGASTKYTNLRIASVNELKTDNNMVRPLNIFVDCVLNHKSITVFNGNQIMSFVDPRDVAIAIKLICLSDAEWKDTYNVGAGNIGTCRLIEMAEKVVETGVKLGFEKVGIDIVEKDISQTAGLDIERINIDFGYEPAFSLEDMIMALFEMKRKQL